MNTTFQLSGWEITLSQKEIMSILKEYFSGKIQYSETPKVALSMTMTFNVWGKKMTFSKEEMAAILEDYFSGKAQHNATTTEELKPIQGKWFEVKPQSIYQGLFTKKREDYRQEEDRQLIIQAFEEMKKNPEKYGKDFKILIPIKDWDGNKTISELKQLSSQIGDHNQDWVELGLEWAQIIANYRGTDEGWDELSNQPNQNETKVVIWEDKNARMVGGWNKQYGPKESLSYIHSPVYKDDGFCSAKITLSVVRYE